MSRARVHSDHDLRHLRRLIRKIWPTATTINTAMATSVFRDYQNRPPRGYSKNNINANREIFT